MLLVALLIPLLRLLAEAQLNADQVPIAVSVLALSIWATAVLALYGLFIMYRLTFAFLPRHRTTAKFACIKGVVVLIPTQKVVLALTLGEVRGNFWFDVLLGAEMVLLGLGWTVLPRSQGESERGELAVGEQILERQLVVAQRAGAVTDPAVDELARRLTRQPETADE